MLISYGWAFQSAKEEFKLENWWGTKCYCKSFSLPKRNLNAGCVNFFIIGIYFQSAKEEFKLYFYTRRYFSNCTFSLPKRNLNSNILFAWSSKIFFQSAKEEFKHIFPDVLIVLLPIFQSAKEEFKLKSRDNIHIYVKLSVCQRGI